MQLKNYQRQVIRDLSRYLEIMGETRDMSAAFREFWAEKGVKVGKKPLPAYQNIVPGVPCLCAKVPTGGGKTFLACHAIRTIFDGLPSRDMKTVVWLVPSEAILTQTLAALKNVNHEYRKKIDVDFGGRVRVYSKQELLAGQNFNIGDVEEQLSVMVLSYDSFRGRKENLKARQENSNLAEIAEALGAPENPVPDADETALLQVINQLTPLVIVDESHHAKSNLSVSMLRDFNPCFILELTATPREESNIFSFVDAIRLKKENMVKLPVVVFNRDSQTRVLADAVDLRRSLEYAAKEDRLETKRYIRPIVLFQAQPKGQENHTTYEKLRDRLVQIGIPSEHIAIRTAEINELKNVNLLSEDCPIRYIITINALKEGWDCPFAYILASLANKTSEIDVEQIVGRILRLPEAKENPTRALNQSYVLTSSADFHQTLNKIILGLNHAGFSEKDYRVSTEQETKPENQDSGNSRIEQGHQTFFSLEDGHGTESNPHSEESEPVQNEDNDFMDFNPNDVLAELERRKNIHEASGNHVNSMLAESDKVGEDYDEKIKEQDSDPNRNDLPEEVQNNNMSPISVRPEFENEIRAIRLPQFFYMIPGDNVSILPILLEKNTLTDGFTLKGKSSSIDFGGADQNMVIVDIRDSEGNTPRVYKMDAAEQRYVKEKLSHLPEKERIEKCKGFIYHRLNKMNEIDGDEIKRYIDLVVDNMTEEQLVGMDKLYDAYARKIQDKIKSLMLEFSMRQFDLWLETEVITCRENWAFPSTIYPKEYTNIFGKTLYTAEEKMDKLENTLALELTAMRNVRWWHRNIKGQDFRINGFIDHYPDFIIMTEKGTLILAETKGRFLDNDDSKLRVKLGRAWEKAAGAKYRYYMVFPDKDQLFDGVYSMSRFLEILNGL